jgi:hypothetical protein
MHRRRACIPTGIEQLTKGTKYGLGVRHFCHSKAKLATPKSLCR